MLLLYSLFCPLSNTVCLFCSSFESLTLYSRLPLFGACPNQLWSIYIIEGKTQELITNCSAFCFFLTLCIWYAHHMFALSYVYDLQAWILLIFYDKIDSCWWILLPFCFTVSLPCFGLINYLFPCTWFLEFDLKFSWEV